MGARVSCRAGRVRGRDAAARRARHTQESLIPDPRIPNLESRIAYFESMCAKGDTREPPGVLIIDIFSGRCWNAGQSSAGLDSGFDESHSRVAIQESRFAMRDRDRSGRLLRQPSVVRRCERCFRFGRVSDLWRVGLRD
jgi:hypothetical protein